MDSLTAISMQRRGHDHMLVLEFEKCISIRMILKDII